MFVTIVVVLLFTGAAAIALALILTITTKQKRLVVFPRHLTDSEHLVRFFAYVKYNKNKGRKRFLRIPLGGDKNSIVSTLPNIVNVTELGVSSNRIEIDDALTKPGPYQWRDMQTFARKTLAPLLVGTSTSQTSSCNVVVCLNVHDELPHFEFFRVAISKCTRHVKKISIIVYDSLSRDRDISTEESLANALMNYLREFDCVFETGATRKNFNVIRNAANVVVLPQDAFGIMAAISGYNLKVVKLASRREETLAWPANFMLLRDFTLIDRKTYETKHEWIEKLTMSCRSGLKAKEPTFIEKIAQKMGEDIVFARSRRNCTAPICRK